MASSFSTLVHVSTKASVGDRYAHDSIARERSIPIPYAMHRSLQALTTPKLVPILNRQFVYLSKANANAGIKVHDATSKYSNALNYI